MCLKVNTKLTTPTSKDRGRLCLHTGAHDKAASYASQLTSALKNREGTRRSGNNDICKY